eukprot:Opistho-2@71371
MKGIQSFVGTSVDGVQAKFKQFTNAGASVENGSANGEVNEESFLSSLPWSSSQNDGVCGLSRKQRALGFMACLVMCVICFSLAFLYLPMLVLKARKFVLLYTLGSVFTICSFALLQGPWTYAKHLFSGDRVLFTVAYFATLVGTLYSALSLQSTILTIAFACIQIGAFGWYFLSYLPGGALGLKMLTAIFTKTVWATAKHMLPS